VDAIVVVDMQVGLLNDEPKHDLQGVIQRINLLTAMMRKQSGKVIWIRHCGKTGETALSGIRKGGRFCRNWAVTATML
jgi:nicotinamidase-related amidase